MRPAVCVICGKSAAEESPQHKGGWVQFADYQDPDPQSLDHPVGLEYLCRDHIQTAAQFTSKASAEAISELRELFGDKQVDERSPRKNASWWQRLVQR